MISKYFFPLEDKKKYLFFFIRRPLSIRILILLLKLLKGLDALEHIDSPKAKALQLRSIVLSRQYGIQARLYLGCRR